MKKIPRPLLLPTIWVSSALFSLLIVLTLVLVGFDTKTPARKYALYSSKPLVLGEMTAATQPGDSRAAKIDEVFETYKCPITGLGKKFVEEADKYGIPYWVVPAIAFQESSCGKQTPEVGGVESHNAWGWAVYGDNVKMFDSWEQGIEVVSKYMYDRFFSQGVSDFCEIMKIYTPPSNGSWCQGIDFFRDEIHEYVTPENPVS